MSQLHTVFKLLLVFAFNFIMLINTSCISIAKEENSEKLLRIKNAANLNLQHYSTQLSFFEPQNIQPDQYVQYLITKQDGKLASLKMKSLKEGELAGSYWFEIEYLDDYDLVVLKLLLIMDESRSSVALQNSANFKPVISDYTNVFKGFYWEPGDTTWSEFNTDKIKRKFDWWGKPGLISFLEVSKMPMKKIVTKAGNFNCFEATSKIYLLTKNESTLNSCINPIIPFSGVAEGIDSQNTKWELVDFSNNYNKSFTNLSENPSKN